MTIPFGFCHCGCNQPTPISKRNRYDVDHAKGQPTKYIRGHRKWPASARYLVEDRGYKSFCWTWQGCCDKDGYGTMTLNRRRMRAHRFYYTIEHGEVPPELHLDHLCRIHSCVNPDHLEPVTCAVNVHRGVNAKLVDFEIPQIRDLRKSGRSYAWIASQYGVSPTAIQCVTNGFTWRGL